MGRIEQQRNPKRRIYEMKDVLAKAGPAQRFETLLAAALMDFYGVQRITLRTRNGVTILRKEVTAE
jgi:hypothetical protein